MVLRWLCSLSKLIILLMMNIVQVLSVMVVLFLVKFFDFLEYFPLETCDPREFLLLPMLNR